MVCVCVFVTCYCLLVFVNICRMITQRDCRLLRKLTVFSAKLKFGSFYSVETHS